ncbi:MAG TPA: response regulator [Candidatus Methylomirabilis sp.]|nr:response regulator [Candidatus Methylomirabilis sp.]
MAANQVTHYCPSCGEHVPTYTVPRAGGIEIRCAPCGLPLSLEASPPLRGLACIMIADDDRFFRSVLGDILNERGLTTNVISAESGPHFLTLAVERFRQNLPIKLVILDILMEPLDGVATALALRAIEQGLNVPQSTPVLFLSAARLDDATYRQLSQCRPARYLNKGLDATPDKLGPRLDNIIGHLFRPEHQQT